MTTDSVTLNINSHPLGAHGTAYASQLLALETGSPLGQAHNVQDGRCFVGSWAESNK